MASRTGGRGDERSGSSNATGINENATRRQGTAAQGTSAGARPNTPNRASQSASSTGSQRQSATQNQSADQTANRSQNQSGSQSANRTEGQSRDAHAQQRERSSSTDESPRRGDQEREVRTSREQGNMRPAASAQRGSVGTEREGYDTSSSSAGSNPFALMRRMMEDMDRIFSDFGFTTPGMFGSSLLNPELSPSSRQRSVGAGTPGTPNRSPVQGAQQGLTRGGQGRALQQSTFGNLWAPQVEILERGNNFVVRADLPGLSRENVDVELDDDALIIRGERQSDVEEEDQGFYRSERSYGSFYRAIPLPEGIDASACNATFRDGVLEVTLPKPKQQPSRARRIDVRGA